MTARLSSRSRYVCDAAGEVDLIGRLFDVQKVDVDISSLKYSVSESDHWILNSLLTPFARPFITKALDKAVRITQLPRLSVNAHCDQTARGTDQILA